MDFGLTRSSTRLTFVSGAPVGSLQVFPLAVHGNRSALPPHREEDNTSLVRHVCGDGERRADVFPSGAQPSPLVPCGKRTPSVKQLRTLRKHSQTLRPLAHLLAAETVAFSFLLFTLALNFSFRVGPAVYAAVRAVLLLVGGAVRGVQVVSCAKQTRPR